MKKQLKELKELKRNLAELKTKIEKNKQTAIRFQLIAIVGVRIDILLEQVKWLEKLLGSMALSSGFNPLEKLRNTKIES